MWCYCKECKKSKQVLFNRIITNDIWQLKMSCGHISEYKLIGC